MTSNTSVGTDKEKAFSWRNITLLDLCLQNGGSFAPRSYGVFVINMKPPVILNSFLFIEQ